MTVLSDHCPDPEVIAAFVAGNLSGTELSMTAEHLRICEDCREVAAEAARVDREGVPFALAPKAGARTFWWITAAAAAFSGLVLLAYLVLPARERHDGIHKLVAAAPTDGRYLEARLTGGFPWAPLRSRRGGADLDPGRMRLIGAAGEVLQMTQADASPEGRHAAAVAHLLAGDSRHAEEVLSRVVSAGSDARMWSDLAAIRYAEALQSGDSGQFAQALAAADAALRIDSELPEARFNRALALEHLGPPAHARAAWGRYLAVDSSSSWSEEARKHLQSLAPRADFGGQLKRDYAVLQRDPKRARELAGRYPEEARVWGETEILARWAEATIAGDSGAAAAHLQVARAFAEVTSRLGDRMLAGAVAAIEAAGDRRQELAKAHLQFRAAQRMYRAGQRPQAEELFAQARQGFEHAGSPVALLATYFGANTAYDQGRVAEACSALEKLAAAAPPQFPAHRAQVGWELGLANASLGRWGDAIRALNGSVDAFERLQENGHASFVRELLAEAYEQVGERRAAWRHRIAALRGMGSLDGRRARALLHGAAITSGASRDWPLTASLLRLELELPADGDDLLQAETLLDLARVLIRLGDHAGAASDLARAAILIKRLPDTAALERAEADRLAVEASLKRDPAQAVAAFSQAIEFHRLHGRHMFVPELLLERGRALKAAGKRREAAEDFETGITETERQHASLATAGATWRVVAVGDDLLEEAIACAADRGDVAGAFAYAERSRAQAERSPVMPAISLASAVMETKVVEYATLPDRVVIFVVDHGHVRLAEQAVRKADLVSEIEEVTRAANARDLEGFRRASSRLYARLVEPVAEDLRSTEKLTFVPDAALSLVPFGALLDSKGRYIIEDHAVVTVPSHAWNRRLSARRSPPDRRDPHLLLMQGPEASDGDSLWSSRREADGVRRQYQSASVVSDGSARMDFEKRAADADVIHFVGHAVIPDGSVGAALVTSRETGAAGRLEAEEIASMSFPRTRVVVLAACGTARDLQRPGDLSISVARAFLTAGVPSVVATLWPIDDTAAAEFFPRLHAHLVRDRTAAEALRATQLEWIHREGASPGMWAAVQIIGN